MNLLATVLVFAIVIYFQVCVFSFVVKTVINYPCFKYSCGPTLGFEIHLLFVTEFFNRIINMLIHNSAKNTSAGIAATSQVGELQPKTNESTHGVKFDKCETHGLHFYILTGLLYKNTKVSKNL